MAQKLIKNFESDFGAGMKKMTRIPDVDKKSDDEKILYMAKEVM